MAFTFIVETGQGIPFSNSYVTVEEADDYLAANIHANPAWTLLDDEDKEAMLVWASRYLDQRAIWNGSPTAQGQSMRWPRTGVYDADGFYIDDHTIPQQLKSAVIEMARYLIGTDLSSPQGSDGLSKLKVDVIELTFNGNQKLSEVPSSIALILTGLGTIKSGLGGHAKILRA